MLGKLENMSIILQTILQIQECSLCKMIHTGGSELLQMILRSLQTSSKSSVHSGERDPLIPVNVTP